MGLDAYQPSLIVLDSISAIEHSTSVQGFRQFMIGVASLLREHGRSALLTQTITSGRGAEVEAPYLSTVADAILVTDYDTRKSNLERTLRVLKMRGSHHSPAPRRLHIEPGGLRIEPIPPSEGAPETSRRGATGARPEARPHFGLTPANFRLGLRA